MNLTIGNTKVGTWKSIRAQYVAAACGLALAVSAVVAVAAPNDRPLMQAARPAGIVPEPGYAVSQPHIYFYIASDQAQIDMANALEESAQWMRDAAGVAEPNRSVIILKAASQEEAARAEHYINEAMAAANFNDSNPAPRFTVVDLR